MYDLENPCHLIEVLPFIKNYHISSVILFLCRSRQDLCVVLSNKRTLTKWIIPFVCRFQEYSFFIVCNMAVVKNNRTLWTVPFSRYSGQIHSQYFFFTFIRKVTWLIKFETRKCSEVKDLTFFPLCRGICENVFHFFTLTMNNTFCLSFSGIFFFYCL
jgi:hypothetical protein